MGLMQRLPSIVGARVPRASLVLALLLQVGCNTKVQQKPAILVAEPVSMSTEVLPGQEATELDRGIALIKNERYAEGIVLVEKSTKASAPDAEITYYLALAYQNTGRKQDAEAGYRRALELDAKLVDARVNLAAIYLEEPPQPERAIEVLEPAVALDPKAADIHLNLAFAYRLVKRLDKAAEHYRGALAVEEKLETRQMLVDVLFDAGKGPEFVVEQKRIVSAFGSNPKALAAIGARFAKFDAYEECAATFSKAIALEPKEPTYYLQRGLCRHELKEPELAVAADFKKTTELDPKNQAAFYYLAMAMLGAKDMGKAVEALEKAVRLGYETPYGKKANQQLEDIRTGGKSKKKKKPK